MSIRMHWFVGLAIALTMLPADLFAVGMRGGGGRGGGGGARGGGGRPAMARPSGPRPSMSRPSMSRPSPSRPNISRPSPSIANRPSVNRPSPGRPGGPSIGRPGGGIGSAPSFGGGGRPGFERPSIGGGSRPGVERPSIGGGSRPGFDRPSIGGGSGRPSIDRPSFGDIGRPGGNRPGTLPSRPDGRPDFGGSRPGTRPSPGDVGDFLGIGRPVDPGFGRPTRPGDGGVAGGGNRPGRPGGDRPIDPGFSRPTRPGDGGIAGGGNRPGRPGGGDNRPGRPGDGRPDRPGNRPGGRPDYDHNFHNRPGWVHNGNNNFNNIHNNWNTAIVNRPGMNNWLDRHPERWRHYNDWGRHVHNHWNHWNNNWFRPGWWDNHWCWHGGWNYWGYRPWGYWWTIPTWGAVTGWFGNWGWSQPVYYDYGSGGNVIYEGDTVYVNGQNVGTPADMAMSAADLATVPAPASDEEAEKSDWMALGTFAVSTNQQDTDPTRVLQLAVNKEGIVSGTLYNTATDKALGVQGKVDKETQRVAFRIGENEQVVCETGIYNLTQNEAPLLVHYGTEKTEQFLLVRLQAPEDAEASPDEGRSF